MNDKKEMKEWKIAYTDGSFDIAKAENLVWLDPTNSAIYLTNGTGFEDVIAVIPANTILSVICKNNLAERKPQSLL